MSIIPKNQVYPLMEFLCRPEIDLPPKGALVRVVFSGKVQEIVVSYFSNISTTYMGFSSGYKRLYARQIWGLDPVYDRGELLQNSRTFEGKLLLNDMSEYSQWALPEQMTNNTIILIADDYFADLKARIEATKTVVPQLSPVMQIMQEYIA